MRSTATRSPLLLIFLLALAARLAGAAGLVALGQYQGDEQYVLTATRLVHGEGYYIETTDLFDGLSPERTGIIPRFRSSRAPLYPLVLAALVWVFGSGTWTLAIFHSLLAALLPPLIYLIGLRLFDRTTAAIAAGIMILYPYSVFHDVRPFETGLFEVLLATLVLLLLRLADAHERTTAALAGIVLAALVATKSFVVALPAVIAGWLLWRARVPRAALRSLVIMGAAAGLTLAPWVARNYVLHHTLVPTTTYGGWVFYLGNNPWSMDLSARGLELDGHVAARLNESQVDLSGLSEVEIDRWFYARGLDYVASHPADAVRRWIQKARLLWSPRLHPRNPQRLRALGHAFSYGIILVLGLVGITRSLARSGRYVLLYSLFIYFTLVYASFTAVSRHRKPLDAYLALFAASAVAWLWRRRQDRAAGQPPPPSS